MSFSLAVSVLKIFDLKDSIQKRVSALLSSSAYVIFLQKNNFMAKILG